MTGSDEVNEFAASQLKSRLGENGTFRLLSAEESKNPDTITDSVLFSTKASYLNINKIATDYPVLQEKLVANANNINEILNDMEANNCIPLLLKKDNGKFLDLKGKKNLWKKI